MKNFLQLATNIDVLPVVTALARHPGLWDRHTLRTQHPGTAHSAVSDLWLMFNAIPDDPTTIIDDREVIPYPAWHALPQVRPIVFALMRQVEGVRLGRTLITKLPPGRSITPHVDGGAPAEYFDRYQIALQNLPGSTFRAGREVVHMPTGSVWWFDNQQEHEVVNNSADDRIALIVDIRSE